MVLFFLPSETLFLAFCFFHHSFTFEILFFQDWTFFSRKHWSLQLLSKPDLCTRRSQNWKRWWLRNQRQQLKRDTKEWVAANSEVHVFFVDFEKQCEKHVTSSPSKSRRKTFFLTNFGLLKIAEFWEKISDMLHHHPFKSGRKTFFWQVSNSLKIWEFWEKMRDMSHHHPLKSGRKACFWQICTISRQFS